MDQKECREYGRKLLENIGKVIVGKEETIQLLLAALPKRLLIGDDEHGWDDNGVFNFEGGLKGLSEEIEKFVPDLITSELREEGFTLKAEKKNEGFMTAGQVQYVCRAGNFADKGLPYTGALKVLKVMMGYDYLWNQVRVKGGAYGCMCGFYKNGDGYFVSYRDPNLQKTIEVYENAAQYIKNAKLDERMLTQFIIGAISELDTPMTMQKNCLRQVSMYFAKNLCVLGEWKQRHFMPLQREKTVF